MPWRECDVMLSVAEPTCAACILWVCTGIRQFLEACPGTKAPQPPALASVHEDERLLKVTLWWTANVLGAWNIQHKPSARLRAHDCTAVLLGKVYIAGTANRQVSLSSICATPATSTFTGHPPHHQPDGAV